MRAEKIVGLANSVLGGKRGEAIKLIAKGAQMWRDPNAAAEPEKAAGQDGQPQQPGQPAAQPAAPPQAPAGRPSGYGAPPQPQGYGAPPQPQGGYGAPPPQPAPQEEGLEADEWAILRIMAAAAQADGMVAPHEQTTILGQAQKLGASPQQMQQLNFELHQKVSVKEIVHSVDSVAARKLMYQFAFAMVKSDHQVTQTEMSFLTELANATELSHEVLGQLVRGVG